MASAVHPVRSANLSIPRTPLVGRTAEVTSARALLLDASAALVTLTGPGGVGKTRLAVAIADDVAVSFADGVVFVDLAPIRDPALVLPTIAAALDVRDAGELPLPATLAAVLKPRQLLLLLDNFEQVLEAAPAIASLLASCPALQVLATSRAPLHLRCEHTFPVSPLALPADVAAPAAALIQIDAVALFLQRALAVDPNFVPTDDELGAITESCRRLDGLPLAIELAAARLNVLSPTSLLAHLSERLRLLTGGARDLPDRQRTMSDAIAWSYDLLAPAEQQMFRRLAVFVGGFTLDAVEAVSQETGNGKRKDGQCSAFRLPSSVSVIDGIAALVNQSLVEKGDRVSDSRFSMLETVREFALERLREQAEETRALRAHADYFLTLVERAESDMYGPAMRLWLDRLEDEIPNIRTALDTFAEMGDATAELRLVAPMDEYWWQRGHAREGMERLEGALARGRNAPPGPRAKAAAFLAGNYAESGNTAAGLENSARALAWARESGDDDVVALALWVRALVFRRSGNPDDLAAEIALLQEAVDLLAGRRPAPWVLSYVLGDLGAAVAASGARARGATLVEQALALDRTSGEPWAAGVHLGWLGVMAQEAGDLAQAAALFGESVRSLGGLGDAMTIAWPLGHLAVLAAARGMWEQAARLLGAVAAVHERTGVDIRPPAWRDDARAEAASRAGLGDDTYAAAIAAGHRLPLAEAVTEAITLADELVQSADEPIASVPPLPLPSSPRPADPFGLSPREREILTLLSQRLTDPEIATALFISPRTVHRHASNLFDKLGVNSRREAAAVAARCGLV